MKYELAIFDLDGTILDTLADLKSSLNASLRSQGLPDRSLEEVRSFVGSGIRRLLERSAPENTGEEQLEQLFSFFMEYYRVHCMDESRPYEGVEAMLANLRSRGMKTAVLSNKADYAVQILCSHFFEGLFDYTAGMLDGVPKKPDPAGVYRILEALGVSPERSVYIGDSEVDIRTAQNAGIACIAVDWGFRTRQQLLDAGAECLVSGRKELEKTLLQSIFVRKSNEEDYRFV